MGNMRVSETQSFWPLWRGELKTFSKRLLSWNPSVFLFFQGSLAMAMCSTLSQYFMVTTTYTIMITLFEPKLDYLM